MILGRDTISFEHRILLNCSIPLLPVQPGFLSPSMRPRAFPANSTKDSHGLRLDDDDIVVGKAHPCKNFILRDPLESGIYS